MNVKQIAATLAVLGTPGFLVACDLGRQKAEAKEVESRGTTGGDDTADEGSCGGPGACGAVREADERRK